MALGCEVYNYVRVLSLKDFVNTRPVAYVGLVEGKMRVLHGPGQGGHIACVCKAINTNNLILRILFQHVINEVGADESRTASNNNSHFFFLR